MALPEGMVTYPENDINFADPNQPIGDVQGGTPLPPIQYDPAGGPTYSPTPTAIAPQLEAKAATEQGLGTASSLLGGALGKEYTLPSDISGLMQGPGQFDFASFIQGPQMAQVGVQDFQGMQQGAQFQQMDPTALRAAYDKMQAGPAQQLMGGDYDALQQALMLPGQQAIQQG